jgi:hypothetical protein
MVGPFSILDMDYRNPFGILAFNTPIDPMGFLIYSIFEVSIYLLLIIYVIVHYGKAVNLASGASYQYQQYEIRSIPSEIIERSQNLANTILSQNVKGVSIQHKGIQLFSEVINGQSLLFYQDDSDRIPVAMNYALHFPKEYVPLSQNHTTQVKVPNAVQIERFILVVKDMGLINENG